MWYINIYIYIYIYIIYSVVEELSTSQARAVSLLPTCLLMWTHLNLLHYAYVLRIHINSGLFFAVPTLVYHSFETLKLKNCA